MTANQSCMKMPFTAAALREKPVSEKRVDELVTDGYLFLISLA